MRDLQVSLNQTQRVRIQSALQQLKNLSPGSGPAATVVVADSIPVNLEDSVLKFWNLLLARFSLVPRWVAWLLMLSYFVRVVRGHGTAESDGQLVATVCGVVERVNKLVYVRPFRARYKPEIGDIIVGRVIEVAPKRWRLEINFSQDAVLMLSSMNLPDGIQRRRTAVDELNMRSIFEEDDVICAEVRGFQHDGSLQLQARSQKYGKLERGQLLTVPPYLVKRRKQHFHHLEDYGVDLIVGCNGYIWVGEHIEAGENVMLEDQDNNMVKDSKTNLKLMGDQDEEGTFTSVETRRNICRIANAVRLLSALGFTLSLEAIIDTVELSSASNISVKDMLAAEFYVQTAEREVQRRASKLRKKA